jgi:N-glycosylase/DNA lyase
MEMRSAGVHQAEVVLDGSAIVAPYDFGFQLRHYVVAPESREDENLVEIVRLSTGRLVRVEIASRGTVEAPRLHLGFASHGPLSPNDVEEARELISWRLGLTEDLRPFYALAEADPVLSASVEYNFGAKGKSSFTLFDGVVDVICAQNTAFRRMYEMRANLARAFGDPFEGGRVYHASPTPEQLGAAPLEAIRACKVGYRDRFIKGVARAVMDGLDLEAVKRLPREQARAELMRLPGVGPYTADLGLIIGARRQDALFLDVYMKEVLRAFYFDGEPTAEEELARFAEARWGHHRGLAWLYLSTNTEAWAERIGRAFRLRSGALNEADP